MDSILYWLMAFLPLILFKIAYLRYKKVRKNRDSMVFTEAIGLPLTFLQPVIFFKALVALDFTGVLLTVWWGLGFLTVVVMVLWSKLTEHKIQWGNSGLYISWLCKIYYLVYIGVALAWDMPKLVFALSAWIASDQIEKSFASLDADRARRTFHDAWLIRIMYPILLFTPFFYDLALMYRIYGTILFIFWAFGIFLVYREREFMNLPDDPSLLRNMIYFRKQDKP
ncbi:MAG: hypothetical protein HY080_01320 [Gammaproteobacteria bacterium]|nr:hypothetical protein [Gammaproteobacteria bacterium]